MIWNLFVIVFFVNSVRSQATKSTENPKTENIFEKCCGLGKSWAKGGLKCDKFLGPVPGVSQIEQGLCLEAVDICCNRDDHEKSCDIGKNRARNGLGCSENNSNAQEKNNDHYQKDCCEGCKLGILTGSMGSGCVMTGFSFGIPWDPAFMECCKETETSTSTTETSQKTTKSTKGTSTDPATLSDDFNDSLELFDDDNSTTGEKPKNDCEILSGLLCSDICVPVDGSYRCECPEGSVLLDDQRTCKSETPINRCESDNPCEHRCKDNGTAVKCKCDPGFILADDEHSCEQKPPPTEPTTLPSTQKITTTTIGTTKKSTPKPTKTTTIKKTTTTKPIKTTTPFITTTIKKNPTTKKIITTPKLTTILTTVPTTIEMDTTTEIFTTTTEKPEKKLTTVSKNKGTTQAVKKSDKKPDNLPKCPTGYKYNAGAGVCDDINECEDYPDSCPLGKCENVIGSFICHDNNLRDESSMLNSLTGHNSEIKNSCPPGYNWDDQSENCLDIDECAVLMNQPCPVDTHLCVNTYGSFACHELTGTTACPAGFKFNSLEKICQDVDECTEDLHGCLPGVEICRNTEGAYECDVECRKGFEFNTSLNMCTDVDECQNDPCPPGRPICINLPGRYQCRSRRKIPIKKKENLKNPEDKDNEILDDRKFEAASKREDTYPIKETSTPGALIFSDPNQQLSCFPGYKYNGKNCTDIDECTEGPGCLEHERCSNRPGGYDCFPLCQAGWYFERISKTCQDVDECLLGQHNCPDSQICQNKNGSFTCQQLPSCENGYHLFNNGSCLDIDECTDNLHNCQEQLHQYCVNRPGHFDCITRLPDCEAGFNFSLSTNHCEDIDECSELNGPSPCDTRLGERCINLIGSFSCEKPIVTYNNAYERRGACPTGYRFNSQLRDCEDVDECAENLHSCGTDICYNQPGGYTCARRPAPITPSPSSPAEVQPTLDPKNQKKCSTGLKYIRNRGCIDINECEETTEACTSNEDCVNTVGSFTCNCKTGFRRDALTQACVDINECQFEHNDCLPTQRCDNTLGSYICVRFLSCGTGYTLNAATESCEDDDECVLGTHDCSVGYHCRNTVGSFRCDRNPRGQAWTTSTTKKSTTLQLLTTTPRSTTTSSSIRPSPTTPLRTSLPIQTPTTTQAPEIDTRIDTVPRTCPRGFTRGSSNQCIDIDECQYGRPNPCSRVPMSRCINTIGSYQCISRVVCGPGYKIDQQNSATRCVDIDECEDGTHQCGRGQVCKNLPGHYACSCPHGYTIDDNNNCIDIDECRVFGRNPCGGNGKCENTNGSYKCNCDEGFDKIDGDMCQDVDECRNNPDICQHDCINMWGGYRCTCQHGFRLNQNDNRTCLDIDECEEFKENNLCVGFCDNTPGSYECRCPDGYQLGSDGRTCQDFDECSSGPVCRDFNDVCQNTRGGYKCNKIRCPIGYHRDEQRKNRCVRTSRYCPNGDLSCFRSPSHYSFNFITFISMFPIPQSTGQLDLFTMRGTHLPGSSVQFKKSLINVQAPPGLPRATESYFTLRNPSPSDAVLCLTRSIPGPQDIELELSMEIYHGTAFVGSAVAKLFIYVTQYEF